MSDLLAPIEELEKRIGYLAAGGHDIAVFQILDPRELDFAFSKATHFRDTESGRDLYIDPESARSNYLKKINAHLDALRHLCGKHGAVYHCVPTDDPLERVLFDFVTSRPK